MDLQVRCTLRSADGVPANNCVNTFAIANATSGVGLDTIAGNFFAFYNNVGGVGTSLAGYINDSILRPDGLLVEVIEDPSNPPNAPAYSEVGDLQNATTGVPLPQEVAICLSLFGINYLTSPNPGRNRGRVYIGPLNIAAQIDPGTASVSRPNPNVVQALGEAAQNLYADLLADGFGNWGIWSRADDFVYDVAGAWIDNEFDTQRRRGHVRTTRTFVNLTP